MAKDYQSFRRLLLDLVALKNPQWQERNPSDLGVTLVELMAWAGDYLSYEQDALPGTEGYLDTCRHRISAARHARLIDYRMHQGRNAATFLHFASGPGAPGVVPQGARLLTKISQPLRGTLAPPGVVIPVGTADLDGDPVLQSAAVFETTARTRVLEAHNALRIHSWGDKNCCLAKGALEAFVFRTTPGVAPGDLIASRPTLQAGDYLLFEEVLGPHTGASADADPAHRQVVRLVEVENTVDPAFLPTLVAGALTPRAAPADPMLPLQRVRWSIAATDSPVSISDLSGPFDRAISSRGVTPQLTTDARSSACEATPCFLAIFCRQSILAPPRTAWLCLHSGCQTRR